MKIETTFSCGDTAWAFGDGASMQVTIGQVRIEYTNSKGVRGGRVSNECPGISFSNYQSQKGYSEQYMCVETGIGSGRIYTLGKDIFLTKEDCDTANAERIEAVKKAAEEARQRDIEWARQRIAAAEAEIARLREVAA